MMKKRNAMWWTVLMLPVAVFLFLSSAFVQAGNGDIEQIRQAIKSKNARWHADKTSVSGLTMKQKKLRLGAQEDEDLLTTNLSSTETATIPVVTATLATVDWRNVEGVSYVTPVKNQGSCGSCWAFATTAGLESQYMIATAGMPIDLSEQILVSCSGCGTCSGGSSASASNYIRDVGLPVEICFPYTATNNVCDNACLNWRDDTYRIVGWHRASTTTITVDDIKNALYTYGPIVATMYVYNDFYSYRSGVYSYTTGAYVGAHAVLVIGYDDTRQAFIVKNSWGTGWGEAGYFMIDYGEVTGTSRFAYSTMVYDGYGDNPIPVPEPDEPDPIPCSYSLSSTSVVYKPAGGAGNFAVYAQGSCSLSTLTAATSASWVTISSTSVGTSSITIYYKVAVNTGPARTATIDIAGLSFKISQQKAKK